MRAYLPEALFNYLLLLGWNPGDDREVLSRDEMVRIFELEKVHVTAAKFDIKKLQWMNGEYIKRMPREAFKKELKERVSTLANTDNLDQSDVWWDFLCDQIRCAPSS